MLTIVNGVTSKQVLANEIINLLETMGLDGYFYLGYPVLGGIDGKIKVDALLVSEQTGIVLFDLETLAEENMEDKIQLLDELYNNMEAKLKRYGYLSKRRVLQVPINVLSYAPLYKTKSDEICTSIEEVKEYLESLEWKQGEEYYKKLLEAKASFVEKEKELGHKVIMIGDGINDSLALSSASVGIAISDGAAIAREIADVTISADNLHEIVTLKRLSTALMKRIHNNYRTIIGINGGLIALGVTGIIMPTTSALLHNMSTLTISLRSMRNLLPKEEEA